MLLSAQRIRYETLRSVAFGGISGAYVGVGASFANAVRMLKVTNTTDATLLISFNGIDDMDVVAGYSAWIHDYASNLILPVGNLEQSAGDRLYIKHAGVAPTSGTVYVTVIYASSN